MPNIRQSHSKPKQGRGNGFMIRMVVITVLLVLAIVAAMTIFPKLISEGVVDNYDAGLVSSDRFYLPQTTEKFQTVHHQYYSLGYNESTEQAAWVAYELTKASIQATNVKRHDWFEEDPKVRTTSAHFKDYKNSGYTKGHMVPAGDMAFNKTAMEETFFMSNMSPQTRGFNGGIWRELEENVRDWAYEKGKLYVISGPIFNESTQTIGRNKVHVPDAFFKILLDSNNNNEGVAYIIPHKTLDNSLDNYMVTIDEVEEATGFDFFDLMLDDSIEEEMESTYAKHQWKPDKKRFQTRVKHWNNM